MPQITITIPDCSSAELAKKEECLKKVATLNAGDTDRINQLVGNSKALAKLKSNWTMLKAMIG